MTKVLKWNQSKALPCRNRTASEHSPMSHVVAWAYRKRLGSSTKRESADCRQSVSIVWESCRMRSKRSIRESGIPADMQKDTTSEWDLAPLCFIICRIDNKRTSKVVQRSDYFSSSLFLTIIILQILTCVRTSSGDGVGFATGKLKVLHWIAWFKVASTSWTGSKGVLWVARNRFKGQLCSDAVNAKLSSLKQLLANLRTWPLVVSELAGLVWIRAMFCCMVDRLVRMIFLCGAPAF